MMIYDIWLQAALGHGNPKGVSAIRYFGSSEGIFKATRHQRENSGIFTEKDLGKLDRVKITDAEKILKNCRKHGVTPISVSSKEFPKILRQIDNCPLVLYYRGTLPDFDLTPTVAIVGPRRVTEFGEKSAFALARRLCAGGFIVVSGGANGSDSAAHRGAMSVGGKTVCVLPCGHDYDYLPELKKQRGEIEKNGCTISERPPETPLSRAAFHIRNRIISGLSLGVIVVEAPVKSGGLITANHAINHGRDVFVIPGRPDERAYVGSNLLLKDGAIPLLSAMDVFSEYSPRFPDKVNSEAAYKKFSKSNPQKIEKTVTSALSKTANLVYNNMNTQVFSLDDVYVEGLTVNEMISALTELEILGLVKTLPGGRYSKK